MYHILRIRNSLTSWLYTEALASVMDLNCIMKKNTERKEKRCDAQRAAECSAMPKRDVIHVMVQAFYGNRVITMADTEKVDQLIHGNTTYMDIEVDRKIVHLTQYDLQIYSRPLACRMDESGKLLSIEEEDIEIICRYFAE